MGLLHYFLLSLLFFDCLLFVTQHMKIQWFFTFCYFYMVCFVLNLCYRWLHYLSCDDMYDLGIELFVVGSKRTSLLQQLMLVCHCLFWLFFPKCVSYLCLTSFLSTMHYCSITFRYNFRSRAIIVNVKMQFCLYS